MLISEVKGWHYYISWDNPDPANSRTMLRDLRKLGKLTTVHTKTTVVLSPFSATTWNQVRDAIFQNLNPVTGKAFYVNLRSGMGFQISKQTKWVWKKVV